MDSKEFTEKACSILSEHKAEDILSICVKDKSSICDYHIIANGRSMTHTKALAELVEAELDKEGIAPIRREGEREGRWIVLDYGDVLIHIFNDETRLFYHLEKIWGNEDNITKY